MSSRIESSACWRSGRNRPRRAGARARAISASMYASLSPPARRRSGGQPSRSTAAGRNVDALGIDTARRCRGCSRRDSRLGKRRHLAALRLEPAQPDADAEDVHLPAGIVDVVLAIHRVARRLEQVADGVAVGSVPTVTDVQRTGRVRGHELEQDPGPAFCAAGP